MVSHTVEIVPLTKTSLRVVCSRTVPCLTCATVFLCLHLLFRCLTVVGSITLCFEKSHNIIKVHRFSPPQMDLQVQPEIVRAPWCSILHTSYHRHFSYGTTLSRNWDKVVRALHESKGQDFPNKTSKYPNFLQRVSLLLTSLFLAEFTSAVLNSPTVSISRRVHLELPLSGGFTFGTQFLFKSVPSNPHSKAMSTFTSHSKPPVIKRKHHGIIHPSA